MRWAFVSFSVVLILGSVLFGLALSELSLQRIASKKASVIESAQKACSVGVPAEANPYQGVSSHYAQIWLDAWLAQKERSQKER